MAKKKEADFFELMIAETQFATEISTRLKDLFDNYNKNSNEGELQKKLDEIHAIEHKGDIAHAEIVTELNRAFITPIDREDIFSVAENIDRVTNAVENVAFRLWMFDIKELRSDIHDFTDLIVKCVDKTNEIIAEFNFDTNVCKQNDVPAFLCPVVYCPYSIQSGINMKTSAVNPAYPIARIVVINKKIAKLS